MFLAASLDPSYFKQRVNLFVALAPVANTKNIKGMIREGFVHIDSMVKVLVDKEKMYNWFPNSPKGSAEIDAFCALPVAKELCLGLMDLLVDDKILNVPRFEPMLTSTPSGQSYRTWIWYSQAIKTGNLTLYDYGATEN